MQLAYWNCAVLKFSAATLALFFPRCRRSPVTEYPLCSGPLKECRAAGNPGTDMNGWTVLPGGTRRASTPEPFHPLSKGPLKDGHGYTVAEPQLVVPLMCIRLFMTAGLLTFTLKSFDIWETRVHLQRFTKT